MDDDHKKPGSAWGTDPNTSPCLVCKVAISDRRGRERICRRSEATAAWRSGAVKARWLCIENIPGNPEPSRYRLCWAA
jgi:hypothetical protein